MGFQLRHEPGGFYGMSPANVQLAAVILERATHSQYESISTNACGARWVAGRAELSWTGAPACPRRIAAGARPRPTCCASSACWPPTAHHGQRVLPEGWVQEMARPSRVSPESGLLVLRANRGGWLSMSGGADGSAFWVIPQLGLTIVNIVTDEGRRRPSWRRC